MNSLQIKANAKINLALAIKYKRDDGYHEIESIFQEIDLADVITLEKSDTLHFSTNVRNIGPDKDNLCVRAARLLMENYGISGLKIDLQKKIPAGSGLGGGSSDAAAVIKSGLKLYDVQVSAAELIRLTAPLGADIPFFLQGGTARVTGIGEILQPLRLNLPYHILLIAPQVPISTVWAYKNLNLTLTRKSPDYKFRGFRCQNLKVDDFSSEFYNDFEPMVFRYYPELDDIKAALCDSGANYASLSGSGSGIFGLYTSEDEARRAYNNFCSNYRCFLTKPVYQKTDQSFWQY